MGAGRETKESVIDYSAGLILKKKTGDSVKFGDTLAVLYGNDATKIKEAEEKILTAFRLSDNEIKKRQLIYDIIK